MAKKNTQPRKRVKKKYRIEVSSFSLFLWGFGAVFFMAWMFALGVLVGRGLLPDADSALSGLKTRVAKFQETAGKSKRGEPVSQPKETIDETLAFYEKLESKKEEAKKSEHRGAISREGTRQALAERTRVESSAEEGREGVETPGAGAPGLPAAPPEGKGVYTVQLASLEERAKAEIMVRDLLYKGHDAYSYEVRMRGKTYHRVRCGRFATRAEADKYAESLFRTTNIRGLVIRFE